MRGPSRSPRCASDALAQPARLVCRFPATAPLRTGGGRTNAPRRFAGRTSRLRPPPSGFSRNERASADATSSWLRSVPGPSRPEATNRTSNRGHTSTESPRPWAAGDRRAARSGLRPDRCPRAAASHSSRESGHDRIHGQLEPVAPLSQQIERYSDGAFPGCCEVLTGLRWREPETNIDADLIRYLAGPNVVTFHLEEGRLTYRATEAEHRRIAEMLRGLERGGPCQIVTEIRVLDLPLPLVAKFDWRPLRTAHTRRQHVRSGRRCSPTTNLDSWSAARRGNPNVRS